MAQTGDYRGIKNEQLTYICSKKVESGNTKRLIDRAGVTHHVVIILILSCSLLPFPTAIGNKGGRTILLVTVTGSWGNVHIGSVRIPDAMQVGVDNVKAYQVKIEVILGGTREQAVLTSSVRIYLVIACAIACISK